MNTPSISFAVIGWVVICVSPAVVNLAPSNKTPFGFEIISLPIPLLVFIAPYIVDIPLLTVFKMVKFLALSTALKFKVSLLFRFKEFQLTCVSPLNFNVAEFVPVSSPAYPPPTPFITAPPRPFPNPVSTEAETCIIAKTADKANALTLTAKFLIRHLLYFLIFSLLYL